MSRLMPHSTADLFAPHFDRDGLVSAVAQHAETLEILMLAHMNAEAIEKTLETGIAHYWSRSRQSLWKKGESSGQMQRIVDIRVDCDQDAILLKVVPGGDGGACHLGFRSCFFRRLTGSDAGLRLERMDQPLGAT